ncbi:hypothetical protein GMJAKD_17530 [Candidatus Electrothrix aarhusensis]
MIIEIPTSNDFEESACDLLHAAWGQVSELLVRFDEVGYLDCDIHEGEEFDESDNYDCYWKAAKQTIVISYAMVQQGVEFYIKGRIASISPYLLLSGNPSSWPKKCNQQNVLFSTFRTVDAQDLIKLHDTVYPERFSDQFRQWFEGMRTSRNTIMHTVDKRLSMKPEEILDAVLYVHQFFCGQLNWIGSRFNYLDGTPIHSIRYIREHDDHKPYIMLQIFDELGSIVGKLPPSKIKEYFGFDKSKYSYHCPHCYEILRHLDFFDSDFEYFKPYQKSSKDIFTCVVCQHTGGVSGGVCEDCDGNLVDDESGMCLVCGQ